MLEQTWLGIQVSGWMGIGVAIIILGTIAYFYNKKPKGH